MNMSELCDFIRFTCGVKTENYNSDIMIAEIKFSTNSNEKNALGLVQKYLH